MVNILFMVNEVFAGEIENIEVNNEDNLEILEEKSDKEKQESAE